MQTATSNSNPSEILYETGIFERPALIGYKNSVQDYVPTALDMNSIQNFYCINPIKTMNNLKYENISKFKNFLIEFDKMKLEKQKVLVAKKGLPYALATFSGSKSNHYIVSVQEGFELAEYKQLAAIMLRFIFKGQADKSCANPNRLSRTPFAMRGENEQELLEAKHAIKADDLRHWVYETNKNAYFSYLVAKEEDEEIVARAQSLAKGRAPSKELTSELLETFCPNWFDIIESKDVGEGGRHAAALGIGIKLRQCNMDVNEIQTHITTFLENNGKKAAQKEARSIVSWIISKPSIVPFAFQEIDIYEIE